jgi:hypothetical protein
MKELEKIKKELSKVFYYTELEMSDFSSIGLQKHISKISEIVNGVLCDLDNLKTCTVCNYEMCDDCLEDLDEDFGDIKIAP